MVATEGIQLGGLGFETANAGDIEADFCCPPSGVHDNEEDEMTMMHAPVLKSTLGQFGFGQWAGLVFSSALVAFMAALPGSAAKQLQWTVVILTLVLLWPQKSQQPAAAEKSASQPTQPFLVLENAQGAEKPSPAKKPRMAFLDNLKITLTLGVVVYHINVGIGADGWMPYTLSLGNYDDLSGHTAVNWVGRFLSWFNVVTQGYFMCLFFFVSGYFTPSSLARKGVRSFLEDKFRRFGIPLILAIFIFFPLVALYSFQAAFGGRYGVTTGGSDAPLMPFLGSLDYTLWDKLWYIPGQGPLWFVEVLLMLNLTFCWVYPNGTDDLPGCAPEEEDNQRNKRRIALPTFADCLVFGALGGLVQYYLIYQNRRARFMLWDIPILATGGGMVFDVTFFFAGAVAKKNNWLEELLERSTAASSPAQSNSARSAGFRKQVCGFRTHALLLIAAALVFCVVQPIALVPEDWRGKLIPGVQGVDTTTAVVAAGPLGGPPAAPYHRGCKEWTVDFASKLSRNPNARFEFNPPLPAPKAPKAAAASEERKPDFQAAPFGLATHLLTPQLLDFNSCFWSIFRGQFTLTMSWALLQWFAKHANGSKDGSSPAPGTWMALISEAAYGAYLLHWVLWPAVLWAFLKLVLGSGPSLLGDGDGQELRFKMCSDRTMASDTKLGQLTMFAAWGWTVVVTNLILWPLALLLRRVIPGADQVL